MTGPDKGDSPPRPNELRQRPDERAPEPSTHPEDRERLMPPAAEGPPGAAIFSLEGRAAPGLYLAAWVLSGTGAVLALLIGFQASSETAGLVLFIIGAVLLTVGLAAGAGSQILERRGRRPESYRGPAPVLVFFAYFFALALIGVTLVWTGLADPDVPFGFISIGLFQVVGYAVVVWLFVVRSGALSWREMGWPTWSGRGLRPSLRAIGTAIAVVLPATLGILIFSGVLATILGVEAPDVLPAVETSFEALLVAAAAAVIIPIGEELFFRGFALTAWLRDLGARPAIIRSSLFFALIHIVNIGATDFAEGAAQALLQTAAILPLALLLGWLFVRHGMAAAIGGHITYNSVLLFLLLLSSYLPESA